MTPPVVVEDPSLEVGALLAVADTARAADGDDPFDEQTRLDLTSGRRTGHGYVDGDGETLAAAVTGRGELDLVVAPRHRGRGVGSAALATLLPGLDQGTTAWSHGDHPAARALAARHGFEAVRTLLRLRLMLTGDDEAETGDDGPEAADEGEGGDGIRIAAFDPDTDADAWLALNARAFASHPEQGGMTAVDLAERMAEPWFDRHDLLVARDPVGRMVGFHWLKLEPGETDGEVYVLGVAPEAAGHGLGRILLDAGLRRLRRRGRSTASLYVEGDNVPALRLYRRAGFVDDAVHVQYRRTRSGSA